MKLVQTYILITLATLLFSCSEASKKKTITIEKDQVGIIAYGSLMSITTLEKSLQRKYTDSLYLVHLQGYKRAWNCYTPLENPLKNLYYLKEKDTVRIFNTLSLNIMEAENEKMNGILFFITKKEFAKFYKHDAGYEKIEVTDKIEEFEIKGGKIYVYKADEEHTYEFMEDNNTVLPLSYVELVTNACDSIGKEFRAEFEASTIPYKKENLVSASDVFWKKLLSF